MLSVSINLEDASDRAQRKRKHGELRISLDQIGFWPGNRGGFGLSAAHAHEVAWDCLANKRQRYGHVDLVEIPPKKRAKIQQANKRKSEASNLMPQCAPDIYVRWSMTHFVHARKLAKDMEGALILAHSQDCALYDPSLLEDEAAACALASEDNLNAAVALGEDEMQAFGHVDVVETPSKMRAEIEAARKRKSQDTLSLTARVKSRRRTNVYLPAAQGSSPASDSWQRDTDLLNRFLIDH